MLSWDSAMLRTPSLPWTSLHIKQEPIESTMVNSFVPSHSEGFHSSSPSSSSRGSPPASRSPSFRPLTPPGFEASPDNQSRGSTQHQMSTAVTPPKSPSPSPPWANTSEGVPSPGADSLPDGDDEPGLRIPAVNSHGKVKTFKCKQCEFVAVTKLVFWEHTKSHIKPERMLNCPKCPFVTEYKHHLEYHMRNHFGSKPFQCPQCSYSCVNKSMLNSHLKSHSNIYQYRCADCNYATKYCHSLKLHLRKYQHQPAMVLNQDGTPNPLPIIDVYGTRRGPKQKSHNKEEALNNNNIPQQHSLFPHPFGLNFPYGSILPHPMLFPNNNNINDHSMHKSDEQKPLKDEELAARAMQNLSPHLQAMHQRFFSDIGHNAQNFNLPITLPQASPETHSPRSSPFSPRPPASSSPRANHDEESPADALDLTSNNKQDTPVTAPLTPTAALKNRRKGRAFKLDRSVPRIEQADDSMDVEEIPDLSTLMNKSEPEKIEIKVDLPEHAYESIKEQYESEKEAKIPKLSLPQETVNVASEEKNSAEKPTESYDCQYCDIVFKDIIMYTMHMGYHGFKDPFTCNMCGHKSDDKVSFFVHIARSQHS